MNTVIYTLMNKINESRIIDQEYLENLYKYYEYGINVSNCQLEISKYEFERIITVIYDVLRLKISEEEFNIVINNYMNLLIADSRDNYNVDCNWFIDHSWYLVVGVSECDHEKYNDCILFIQKKLIKEFNINEKVMDKIKRKIFISYITK